MNIFCKFLSILVMSAFVAGRAAAGDLVITLASTTSTQNSGLLDYLLPVFRDRTGIEVRVIAVGTGQALKLAEKGDADVILVHDKQAELKFVKQGYGLERREVMYNDFIIVGPGADPAGVRGMKDAALAFAGIAREQAPFVSRADDSGTHRQELRMWQAAQVDPEPYSGKWYKEIGAGMGATLNTAAGIDAYTLSDRATWASFKNRGRLQLLVQDDPRLFNQYAVILVNPSLHPHVKSALAGKFSDWLVSEEGQQLIGAYQIEGQVLFYPNAGPTVAGNR